MTVAAAPSAATLPSGDRALDLARSYGVDVRLKADRSGLILEADTNPPPDVLEALRAAKPDLLRILSGREAAKAASESAAPPDCPERRWAKSPVRPSTFRQRGVGRSGGAARVDDRRAVPRASRLESRRPHRRGALDRRSPSGRGDRSLDCDRNALRRAS
jgi:hypothetical protein